MERTLYPFLLLARAVGPTLSEKRYRDPFHVHVKLPRHNCALAYRLYQLVRKTSVRSCRTLIFAFAEG